MAPVIERAAELAKRCDYIDRYGNCRYYSAWYWWGRWVLAGVIVILFLLVLISIARKNSRARRARGQTPLYGTGFLAGPPAPPYSPYPQNGSTNVQGGPPPPNYVYPDNTGNKFNPNDGYYGNNNYNTGSPSNVPNSSSPYGNQQQGIELQQPATTYQRGTGGDDYAPPEGPPPGRK